MAPPKPPLEPLFAISVALPAVEGSTISDESPPKRRRVIVEKYSAAGSAVGRAAGSSEDSLKISRRAVCEVDRRPARGNHKVLELSRVIDDSRGADGQRRC